MSNKSWTDLPCDAWEASCLKASRELHLVRAQRLRELEEKVKRLEEQLKEYHDRESSIH